MKTNRKFSYRPGYEAVVYIVDTKSVDAPAGYCHLYEHMVIKMGQGSILELLRNGGYSNAATEVDSIVFIFAKFGEDDSTTKKSLRFDSLFDFEPLDEALESEKHVIAQERLLVEYDQKRVGTCNEDIDVVLGSQGAINRFDINTLRGVIKSLLPNIQKVEIGPSSSFYATRGLFAYDDMSINSSRTINTHAYQTVGKSTEIRLTDMVDAELVAYYLRIIYADPQTPYPTTQRSEHGITIIIEEPCAKFMDRLSERLLYLKQYALMLDSFKFFLDEITYIIKFMPTGYVLDPRHFLNSWKVASHE